MSEPVRVLLVDDHVLFRQGIKYGMASRQDMQVVGEASDGQEAIALARETMPDVILMDISMPCLSGLDATRQIRREMPNSRIVILTFSDDDQDMFEAIKAGASGYLLKNVTAGQLYDRIRVVAQGEVVLSGVVAGKILEELAGRVRPDTDVELTDSLTAGERRVLELLAKGLSNSEIASQLVITEGTVKNHLKSILEKLQLKNRVQAALYAVKHGLVQDP